MTFKKKLTALAGLLMAMCLGSQSASANSILVNFTGANWNGTDVDYTYHATLEGTGGNQSRLDAGDYFVISDFDGFTGSPVVPTGWSVQWINAAITTPFGVVPANDKNDLIVTYNNTDKPLSFTDLGYFTFTSSLATSALHGYAAQDHRLSDGTAQYNQGSVLAPDDSPQGGPTPLPTPVAAGAGMGLFGFMAAGRRKK